MHGVAGIGATLMPTIMQLSGRKYTFIGSSLLLLIGWILAFVAKDVLTVLLSAIFHGLSSNCITIINLVIVSEMLAPKYRSVSMALLIVNQTLGQVIVSTLGTVLNWQTVALVMCGPVFIALLMVTVWPESPSWLAYKGKFEATEKAFIWLRGTEDDGATKELKALIAAQKESRRSISKTTKFQETWQKMKGRDLYLPTLYMFLILINFYFSGAMPLYIYSKDILEAAIGDPKIAVIGYVVCMFSLLTGSLISLVLLRYFKTKTVLSTSFGCTVCLLSCSLVSYLQSIGFVAKGSILFLYFYVGYMAFCNSGFNPISYSLAIDLMPVKHRGFGGALFNILTCLLYVITVKSFLYIISYIGISWMFFLLGISCLIFTILIWIYVPETKNRTLQEIEDYYNYGTFARIRDLEDAEVIMPIVKKE